MVRIGYTSSGQAILIDDTLYELVEATEDGIVTVELVKRLIANACGHSYEEVVIAVKNSESKDGKAYQD